MLFSQFEFSIQNVIDGRGIGIALTGMAIVFVALSLITAFIALLPKLLQVTSNFLPPEADRYALPAAVETADTEDDILAAIGYVLHTQARNRDSQT